MRALWAITWRSIVFAPIMALIGIPLLAAGFEFVRVAAFRSHLCFWSSLASGLLLLRCVVAGVLHLASLSAPQIFRRSAQLSHMSGSNQAGELTAPAVRSRFHMIKTSSPSGTIDTAQKTLNSILIPQPRAAAPAVADLVSR